MNLRLNSARLLWGGILGLAYFAVARAQPAAVTQANDFTEVEYFEPPHQEVVKSRLSGTQAQPETGGLLEITQLRLETFDSNGVPGLIVTAPHCVYDKQHNVAYSSGHLRLETADGNSHVEGDGFLWRQESEFLTISNRVQTVIENRPERKTGP